MRNRRGVCWSGRLLLLGGWILGWAAIALAQEVALQIALPRNSLHSLIQALNGTSISYQGVDREDLQGARLTVRQAQVRGMGGGQILVGLEGTAWILYRPRPEEMLGASLGRSLEVNTTVGFGSELALTPQVEETSRKLILNARVIRLDLKEAEGFYQWLLLVPGVDQIARAQINRALQSMRLEILDLSPYLVPQEFDLQDPRWSADRTLLVKPKEVRIEVGPEALMVQASAKVTSQEKK